MNDKGARTDNKALNAMLSGIFLFTLSRINAAIENTAITRAIADILINSNVYPREAAIKAPTG